MSKYNLGNRDILSMVDLYTEHVDAMTSEGLHKKSDIAAELAWRDDRFNKISDILLKERQGQVDKQDALDRLTACIDDVRSKVI